MTQNPFRIAAARLFAHRTRTDRSSSRVRRRPRLGLEPLEGRDVPAGMTLEAVPHESEASPAWSASPAAAGGFTPAQIRHAYGIDAISIGGITGDGSGQTIAIVDAYDDPKLVSSTDVNFATSDLHAFDVQFGLPDPVFTKVNQTGGATPPAADPTGGWEGEEALDVEWAHAIAPGANIILVECSSIAPEDLIQGGVNWARQQPGVTVVSMSWSVGQSVNGVPIPGDFPGETAYDSYFTTPYTGLTLNGVTFVAAAGDNGTPGGYPALSPNVVAVGGTSLQLDGSGHISSESVWNHTGGGTSTIEPRPGYQDNVAGVVGSQRGIPDVAFNADPNTGVLVYDSYLPPNPPPPATNHSGPSTPWAEVGGTSFATPAWSGLVAIADQFRAAAGLVPFDGATQTLPAIYRLPQGDFHDIADNSSNGTFFATAGYDLVTGRGTPIANLLIPGLVPVQVNPGNPAVMTGDPNGDLFMAFSPNGNIFERTQGGSTVDITPPSNLNLGVPSVLATDAHGHLFGLFPNGPQGVWEYTAGNWANVLSGGSTPSMLAVGEAGNVFMVYPGGYIWERPVGGSWGPISGPNLGNPSLITADGLGDLFASFPNGAGTWQMTPDGTWHSLSNPGNASFLQADANGDLFIGFPGTGGDVLEYWAPNPASSTLVTSEQEVNQQSSSNMAVDAYGNLFIAYPGGSIWKRDSSNGSWSDWAQEPYSTPSLFVASGNGEVFAAYSGNGVWLYTS